MTTAIVYYSKHHGNTKKLLDAIAAKDVSVTLIDVTQQPDADLSPYDRIGLASGIYFSSFAKQVIAFAEAHLPENTQSPKSPCYRSQWTYPHINCYCFSYA